MAKGKGLKKKTKELEAIEDILSYIDLTLKENRLRHSDLIAHCDNCPLCKGLIIKCPFCESHTPIGYQCVNCHEVLPLDTLLTQIAKAKIET